MSSAPSGGPVTKVLVPFNFSAKSEQALDFALRYTQGMAQIDNIEVYLFHVFEESTNNFRRLDKLNEEYMERMKQSALQAIDRVQAQGVQQKVDQIHRRLAHGKPAVEILKMADGIRADFVIMGAPGSGAFKKLVTKIPCTLVLVKHGP